MKIFLSIMSILMLNTMNATQESKVKPIDIVVTIEIEASVKEAFAYIVPVELPHIFKQYKNLPAITGTSNKERWFTSGMERTVYFEDGTTVQEYLLTVTPSSEFSYRIDSFTSPLKRLAKRIEGSWSFVETADGHTYIEWTYSIVPKNRFTRLVVNTFVKKDVQGLLNNALTILKNDLEKK